MLLIPAIDLRAGRCVRLLQGDFAAETRYPVEPAELLERYRRLGATWLHLVDLDGARAGVQKNQRLILELAGLCGSTSRGAGLRLQVGGGVREARTVEALLSAGVSRVVVGSKAVSDPALIRGWLRQFGPEALVLAFDVRMGEDGLPRCAVHGWEEASPLGLWEAIETYRAEGLRHVLCTDIARDGALTGPNVELYKEGVVRCPQLAWQASGGVRGVDDLHALAVAGATAAISGRALLEQRFGLEELRPFLPNA